MQRCCLVLAALLPACTVPPGSGSASDPTTGDATTGEEDTTEARTVSSSGESSGGESTGGADGSSSSGSTGGDSSSSSDSSGGESSSSTGPDTDGSTVTGDAWFCGDLLVTVGEECDDGNNDPSDGCDECKVVRWTHVGVAQEVPLEHLGKWKSCFSGTYEAGAKIEDILKNCDGDHILLGCMPVGGKTLTMAAHAPRADVFFEPQVKYKDGERHLANDVAWYWAPYYGVIGFGPDLGENFWNPCEKPGEGQQMCWRTAANPPDTLASGYRCGDAEGFSVAESKAWLRVAYESWD